MDDIAVDVAVDGRRRLDQAIVAEKADAARLDERVEERRTSALTLDDEERAKAEARYREIQDRIAAQLIMMGGDPEDVPAREASLDDELSAMSAELDKFAAGADDLEGNVRALRRLTHDGPSKNVKAWRDEIGRRTDNLWAATEAAVSQANEMRSTLARVRRMAEPRL